MLSLSRAPQENWIRLCDGRSFRIIVRSDTTLVRWHGTGWQLLWRSKSRHGRLRIAVELCQLIPPMAAENSLWGEERIANELLLKPGGRVSPRTVRKYSSRLGTPQTLGRGST